MAKLKVYRTAIGFHDAYVAASSQKAALKAWGSDADLFARGVAEVVTDDALTTEPLASPGTVVRRLRGTADEQIAEASKAPPAPPRAKRHAPDPQPKPARAAKPKPEPTAGPKPKPRPDRAKLDAAEAALAQAEDAARAEDRRLADAIAALQDERKHARAAAAKDTDRLERARIDAQTAYDRAMAKWREE